MSTRTRRLLRTAAALLLGAGVAYALVVTSRDAGRIEWPAWPRVAVAALLVALTQLLTSFAWAVLLPGAAHRLPLVRGALVAQLGKYVPGAVLQVASQYDLARRAGLPARQVGVALPVHLLVTTLAPGGASAVVLALVATDLAPILRVLVALAGAVLTTATLWRRVLTGLLDRLHRRWARVPAGTHVPSQRSMLGAAGLGIAGMASFGAAFAILLAVPAGDMLLAATGLLTAFTAGLVVLPAPSGLGVREAVLVGLLAPLADAATVLAASVALRAVQLGVELVLAGTVSLAVARRPRLPDGPPVVAAGPSGPSSTGRP